MDKVKKKLEERLAVLQQTYVQGKAAHEQITRELLQIEGMILEVRRQLQGDENGKGNVRSDPEGAGREAGGSTPARSAKRAEKRRSRRTAQDS